MNKNMNVRFQHNVHIRCLIQIIVHFNHIYSYYLMEP